MNSSTDMSVIGWNAAKSCCKKKPLSVWELIFSQYTQYYLNILYNQERCWISVNSCHLCDCEWFISVFLTWAEGAALIQRRETRWGSPSRWRIPLRESPRCNRCPADTPDWSVCSGPDLQTDTRTVCVSFLMINMRNHFKGSFRQKWKFCHQTNSFCPHWLP